LDCSHFLLAGDGSAGFGKKSKKKSSFEWGSRLLAARNLQPFQHGRKPSFVGMTPTRVSGEVKFLSWRLVSCCCMWERNFATAAATAGRLLLLARYVNAPNIMANL